MKKNINNIIINLRNKGFTLVELLAVIVVLSIIALIGFTQVGNVIETAREKAAEESADNYIKAVNLKIMNDMLNGITWKDDEYDVNKISVDMNGTKPSKGTITIKDSKVVSGSFTTNGVDVTYDIDSGVKSNGSNITGYPNGTVVYFNLSTNSKCNNYVASNSTGKNLDGCLKWYAYFDKDDTVNLLLDHNIATVTNSPEYVWWEFIALFEKYDGISYGMLSITDVEKITGSVMGEYTSSEIRGASWLYDNGGNYWLILSDSNKHWAILDSSVTYFLPDESSSAPSYSGRPTITVKKSLLK